MEQEDNTTAKNSNNEDTKKKKKSWIIIVLVLLGAIFLGIPIFNLVIDMSLNGAKDRAYVAMAKSEVSGSNANALMCGTNLVEPKDDGIICDSNEYYGYENTWPNLSEHKASWSGCEFTVQKGADGRIENFEYCATFSDGTVMKCTALRCSVL